MRSIILLSLFASSTAQGGIYGGMKPVPGPTVEAEGVKPLSFGQFRLYFTQYTVDTLKPTSTYSKEVIGDRDRLRALAKSGPLKPADALDLSVTLMRLREYDEAVQILTPLATRDRTNFKLFANLGSAHQAAGRLDRAAEYLQQALDAWPGEWPGMSKAQLDWHKELERFQLRLVRKRLRESLLRSASAKDSMDDLFENASGPIRYQSEDGSYQAGKLAEAERKKLPPDALAILQQLVLWFPDDTRLYWQLGEMYNALGDIGAASVILEECIWTRRFGAPLFREHRKIVLAGAPKQTAPVLEDEPAKPSAPPAEADPNKWIPETRQIVLVVGVAGSIMLALIYLQVKELRNRRRRQR